MKKAFNFVVGYLRYSLYYNRHLKNLIRPHILSQIDYRIRTMNTPCYDTGSCVLCGCTTTALQMANPSCEGLCYPPLTNKRTWATKSPIKVSNTLYNLLWVFNPSQHEYFPYDEKGLLKQQSKLHPTTNV
jgi:hypothetical protein